MEFENKKTIHKWTILFPKTYGLLNENIGANCSIYLNINQRGIRDTINNNNDIVLGCLPKLIEKTAGRKHHSLWLQPI